ncbi:DUF2513 domain-containing protein [Mesorhizobium sp. M0292]
MVREMLFALEAKPDFAMRKYKQITPEGRKPDDVGYALIKMYEAGFITGEVIRSKSTPDRLIEVIPFELTFKGHEFLDSIRDDEIWRKTKDGARKMGGAGIEFMWEMAKAYGKHVAKEKLGLEL